ncbi:MAG TPA: hypothetical protein VM511_12540 [Luteolibacter sp.]|nr:hypothetical protein [Luteolibacter sp.]
MKTAAAQPLVIHLHGGRITASVARSKIRFHAAEHRHPAGKIKPPVAGV